MTRINPAAARGATVSMRGRISEDPCSGGCQEPVDQKLADGDFR